MEPLVQIDTYYGRKTCKQIFLHELIQETDFYKSTSGLWEQVPGALIDQPPSPNVEFLRPIEEE